MVGTNPPARTTPIRLLVEAKASTTFLRRARVCSQPCQRGRTGQRASRQAAGQNRAQKEEVTSVLASHRHPIAPTGRMDLSMAQLAPGEALEPRAKYEKRQSPSWARVSGKNGVWRKSSCYLPLTDPSSMASAFPILGLSVPFP